MANQFTMSRFQRPPPNPQKYVNKLTQDITTVRIIPYYIDTNSKVMILLAESNDWQDWSALGGSCKSSENHIKCLARELLEESQLLFNLDPHMSIQ
jgi:ADP-ribose pyrophosphatase YjhB (NUDIX family)